MKESNINEEEIIKIIHEVFKYRYIFQVIKGLYELDENKIIHRDLKPQNIFFKNK